MVKAERLIVNAGRLLTMTGEDDPDRPRAGAAAAHLAAIEHGALAVAEGHILEIGTTEALAVKYRDCPDVMDARGKLVMPGFVDAHTHLVYAGSREREMAARLAGASYLDILKAGGGINETVAATRGAGEAELLRLAICRMDRMAAHGTTTLEIKSGYGLDEPTETKILSVIGRLQRDHPLDVVATYLGAHAVPGGVAREHYLDWLSGESLKGFRLQAEFCDLFCEEGAFTLEEAERLLRSAKAAGFKLKVHAGQFSDLGAAGAAATLGAVSCDHLEAVSDAQLRAMKEAGTVAVLMPGVPFFLNTGLYPDGRRIIDAGVPVALATDFNPGSCPAFSMQMMVALAVLRCGLTVDEAITAATINSAFAIDRGAQVGSLAPGKQADLIFLDLDVPAKIPYHFGANLVSGVMKRGEMLLGDPGRKRGQKPRPLRTERLVPAR
jgi:imidazolonepropionase